MWAEKFLVVGELLSLRYVSSRSHVFFIFISEEKRFILSLS